MNPGEARVDAGPEKHPGPQLYAPDAFAAQRRALTAAWHMIRAGAADSADRWVPAQAGMEPLVLAPTASCALPNACTHRGAVLMQDDAPPLLRRAARLRCPYHGRQFDPQGRLTHAPGYPVLPVGEDLTPIAISQLGPWKFARVNGAAPLPDVTAWTTGLDLDTLRFTGRTVYTVRAHWALWVENYLEGLHVPFVHANLQKTLDLPGYRTLVEGRVVVQVGPSREGPFLPLPLDHPAGPGIGGLYLYIFPCTALNIYAWGVSVNIVEPVSPVETRVHYERWEWPVAPQTGGPGGALDEVEHEDDAIVERVARGLDAVLARGGSLGSYAPGWEDGTRAFHGWLMSLVDGSPPR